MKLRWLALAGVVFLNSTLHAEVSSDFLVKVRQKFSAQKGGAISAADFVSELSESERAFIEKTQQYDYSDIFQATIPKGPDVYSYDLFHWQSVTDKLQERGKDKLSCHSVYTEDSKTFREEDLRSRKNPPSQDFNMKNAWSFSYCAGGDEDADPESILFYFHGATGNPYNWLQRDSTYAIRQRWRETGKLPKWVSVSIGKIGHLAEIGKEEKFFDVIVPYIEGKLGFSQRPKYRFGLGVSQGGANIVHAVLKNGAFFDAAVAICPAVVSTPPSASRAEWRRYAQRTQASRTLLRFVLSLVPLEFKKLDYWHKEVDALALGQRYLNAKSSPLYIQTSSRDKLGLQEGGQIFAILARTQGARVLFEALEGGHCVLRPTKIADYFTSFQEGELPLQLKLLGRTRR